tara:strand:+ start:414 stop:1064 length:651 start_codon:yes stop_codon:yes gene_type:complete
MEEKNTFLVSRPFGPTIAKVKIPEEMVKKLNDYVDYVIADKKKSEAQDSGNSLAGQVTQEFFLDMRFCETSGWMKFLGTSVANWIKYSGLPTIKRFELISSWVVRQFKNEYNPTHWHSGHVSGVGYLKVPDDLGSKRQENKALNPNGHLELIHGSRQFLSQSTYRIEPKVGEFYFFPNYMMHTVYPFSETDQERRSVSFNAMVDKDIYDIYADKIK